MERNKILCGDALTVLRTLPAESVQCCITSPPYYGLRAYLPDEHPDKAQEIGLEETPAAYIARLVEVFREVRRVLRSDGTCWLNIGDSYSSNGVKQTGRNDENEQDLARRAGLYGTGQIKAMNSTQMRSIITATTGLPAKSLLMIPARVAIALQDDGWILRSDIIWHKPNTMPESVQDRPTSAHEHVFLLAKSERYYYDAEAIAEPSKYPTDNRKARVKADQKRLPHEMMAGIRSGSATYPYRNKRNVWTIATQSYSEAHFATMPPKLVEPCVLAGSRPGDIVLDPFCGAGTVPLVSLQQKRDYLGIELNPEYIKLAEKRISVVQPVLWT